MRYWLKIANFWYLPLFGAPVGVTPSEFCSRGSCGKPRMMALPDDEKSFMVSLAVSIQYTNVTDEWTDRQTDRRTPIDSKDRVMHRFAW